MINLKLDSKDSEELTDFLQTLIEACGISSTQYKVININFKANKGITLKLEDYGKPTKR